MACLVWVFLTFVVVYQCVGVANGAVEEKDLPDYVGNKKEVLERLKKRCQSEKNVRVIASVDLSNCRITCTASAIKSVGHALGIGTPVVRVPDGTPCGYHGAQCIDGICVHFA